MKPCKPITERKRGKATGKLDPSGACPLSDCSRLSSPLSPLSPSPTPPPAGFSDDGHSLRGPFLHLQMLNCGATLYAPFPPCHQCSIWPAGDAGRSCLFNGLRSFVSSADSGVLSEPGLRPSTRSDDVPIFPGQFNEPFLPLHATLLKTHIAPLLLPALLRELEHARRDGSVRLRLELSNRVVCETCLHSMAGSWCCQLCGRELCFDCWERLAISEGGEGDAVDSQNRGSSPGERSAEIEMAILDRMRTCTRNGGELVAHSSASFVPLTRSCRTALAQLVESIETFIRINPARPPVPCPNLEEYFSYPATSELYTTPSAASHPHLRLVTPPSIELFQVLWASGEPILVENDGMQAGLDWTPEFFAQKYGTERCQIIANQVGTESDGASTVGGFIRLFGQPRGDGVSFKIKVSWYYHQSQSMWDRC